jgi:DNA-directed RNA polymerase subunit N (RpoN/RPB10)
MLVPIVCFTCGCSLGDIAPIYHAVRRKRMAARFGTVGAPTAPTQAAVDPTLTENIMGDVLDALRVTKCCRTRLVTAMVFSEHY